MLTARGEYLTAESTAASTFSLPPDTGQYLELKEPKVDLYSLAWLNIRNMFCFDFSGWSKIQSKILNRIECLSQLEETNLRNCSVSHLLMLQNIKKVFLLLALSTNITKRPKQSINECILLTKMHKHIHIFTAYYESYISLLCDPPLLSRLTRYLSVSRLRPIDVEFMKRLGKIVSIVPVIAKADTLTIEERQEFKERVTEHTYSPTTKARFVFLHMMFTTSHCVA